MHHGACERTSLGCGYCDGLHHVSIKNDQLTEIDQHTLKSLLHWTGGSNVACASSLLLSTL